MNLGKHISKTIKWVVALIIMISLVAFTEYRSKKRLCVEKPMVDIEEIESGYSGIHFFIKEQDVVDLITFNGREPMEGKLLSEVDVHQVEKRVLKDRFVEEAEIYKTLKGELRISIKQRRPIARVMRNDSSFYISTNGILLPESNRYSARVPMIVETSAPVYMKSPQLANESDSSFYKMMSIIDKDKFMNKITAQVLIGEKGIITILPQISKQKIIWGKPIDNETKVERLKTFYKEILPSKGWNRYKTVNLSYKDQIICE